MDHDEREPPSPPDAPLPERIGPYRILRLLGKGGMGAVFEARQENPRRTVALKVVSAGVLMDDQRRRFELEAQVLGHLHHPCIAQVYEAGVFESAGGAQPYFAMERIHGEPLTRYAERNGLGIRERLELVARICDGVQHAHERGVIHRDLKPDNILVDTDGQPKILDFGLARATDSDLQASTLMTDVGQIMGTIPYMSPEQAAGDPQAIDARTDVYSLGVVAYELISGRMPYDAGDVNVLEALRAVREDDATPLSSIDRTLRGDVDTIIGKALEKERARRYPSSGSLAEDIRRHLADQPILARPPSTGYQLRKFARRNRALVTGLAAVFAALVIGLIGTARGYLAAEADAARARSTADFFRAILTGVDPAVALGAHTTLFKSVLDDTAARIDTELAGRPLVAASIHDTMAGAYFSIGEYDASLHEATRARELYEPELGEDSEEAIGARHRIVMALDLMRRYREALELAQANLERASGALGPDHARAVSARMEVGVLLLALKRYDAAATHFEPVLSHYRSLEDGDPNDLLVAANCLGLTRLAQHRFEEAGELLEEVLAERTHLFGDRHPETITALHNLAGYHLSDERPAEAERLLRDALARSTEVLGPTHQRTLEVKGNLAEALDDMGREEDALVLQSELFEACSQLYGGEDVRTLAAQQALAEQLRRMGRLDEAEPHALPAYEGLLAAVGPEDPRTLTAQQTLASLTRRAGESERAESLYLDLIETASRALGPDAATTLVAVSDLGWDYFLAGRVAEAEPLLRRSLEGRLRTLGERNSDTILNHATLGKLLHDQGRADEATPLHRDFLIHWSALQGDEHPGMASIAERLALDLERVERHAPHEAAIRTLLDFHRRTLAPSAPEIALDETHLAQALLERGREDEARAALEALSTRCEETEAVLPVRWSFVAGLAGLLEPTEAEEALIRVWEGERSIDAGERRPVARWLAELNEAWGRPEQAERWRAGG